MKNPNKNICPRCGKIRYCWYPDSQKKHGLICGCCYNIEKGLPQSPCAMYDRKLKPREDSLGYEHRRKK